MITAEEHQALATFARLYGRTWRRELAKRWENGTLLLSQVGVSEAHLAALVRLKAKLGPSRLCRYKPPAHAGGEVEPRGMGEAGSSSRGQRSRARVGGR